MDVKRLFVHVKATGSVVPSELRNAVIAKSTGSGSDRIYFLEDTNELIVKGVAYGLSTTDAARIAALETGLTKATGVAAGAFASDAFEITDDSAIGKYVNKIASVTSADGTVKVDKTKGHATDLSVNIDGKSLVKVADGENKGQISVGLDNIIDGATIVKDGGKIKSGLKLVYDPKGSNVGNVTLDHPQMRLVDAAGATVGTEVNVSDFIVDGLLQEVKYNEATHTIDFTWNTDAGSKTASIDISKLFNIEQLHTTTPTYLTVTTTTPTKDGHPHTGDKEGGICFDVEAVVDKHDYDTAFALTHTPASADGKTTESYAKHELDTDAEGKMVGLADAQKVSKAVKYLAGQIVELGNARIAAEKANADAIAHEAETARAAEKVNADAITKLNSDADTDGSVAHSIKTAIDGLDSEVTGEAQIKGVTNTKPLITVKVTQTDGKLTKVDVNASTDSLTTSTDADAEYTLNGTTPIKAKSIDAISAADPTFVTLQDAWMYGQCIKAQAVKEIASDNNDYIHISRTDNKTQIDFEPWAEVSSIDDLNNLK